MSKDDSSSAPGGVGDRFSVRKAHASGIVVLVASNRQVLYVNKAGREWLVRLNGTGKSSARDALLPKALMALVDDIVAMPHNRVEDRRWRRLAVTYMAAAPGQILFVQAFAQPPDPHNPRALIVLTMQSGDIPDRVYRTTSTEQAT